MRASWLFVFLAGCTAVGLKPAAPVDELAAAAPLNDADRVGLTCEGGYSIVASRANTSLITFKKNGAPIAARVNGLDECRHNSRAFLCYRVNENTMINLPPTLHTLQKGDKAKLQINDDVANVPGNGQGYDCIAD